jgi:hypothetical protein
VLAKIQQLSTICSVLEENYSDPDKMGKLMDRQAATR